MSFLVNPYVYTAGFSGNDPHFANVVLLCHFDGTDGQTTTADSSPSAHTLTMEAGSGNTVLDDAQKMFGSTSLLLRGTTTDDSVSAPDHANWDFGSGDFTIEGFVRFNDKDSDSGNQVFISQYDSSGNQRGWRLGMLTGNTLFASFSANGTTDALGGALQVAWTPNNNQWYYVGFERDGNDWYIWVDNTQMDTTNVSATQFNSTEQMRLGCASLAGARNNFVNGWLDEWRVTKGVARYGGVYTVPTAAFPNS